MYQISLFFMKFIIFSIIGYVVEMVTCAIMDKKIANRGFMCGPIIPIYGVGSLTIAYGLKPFANNYSYIFYVVILGMVVASVVEYITSYVLEKIFHNKWWDYSQEKFNIKGRVCLRNAILFGIGTPIILYVIDPWVKDFLLQFKNGYLIAMAIISFLIFILDLIYSGIVAYQLRNRIIIVEDLKNQKLAKIPGMFEKIMKKKTKGLKSYPKRLFKAFPHIWNSNKKAFEIMLKIEEKAKNERKSKK